MRHFATYVATAFALVCLDILWIGGIAKSLYSQGIGHLMADAPRLLPAVAFYLVYSTGILWFAIYPNISADDWRSTAVSAAMLGGIAYATYDLSNLATLRNWPVALSILDIAWGVVLTTVTAITGRAVLTHFNAT